MSGIIVVRGYIGAHDLLERGGQKVRKTERLNLKANGFQRAAASPSGMVLRPSDFRPEIIVVGDLQMHTVIEGPEDGPLIVMLHGFPEFWYSWRYQIKAFAAAGYRTVAVDQRGYNLSDKRGPYDVFTLVGDVVGLVRALGHERAVIMGNDWGGVVAWVLGARHPDIVERLIVLNAPHPSAGLLALRSLYLPQILKSWYVLAFQVPVVPELLMSANEYELFARILKQQTQGAIGDEEIGYFRRAWAQPGALSAGVDWYRASLGTWMRGRLKDLTVHTPSLLIWGDRDAYLTTRTAEWTRHYVVDLEVAYIRGASHWVQQDSPETVNRYALDFLRSR
jgi:pimeloyl-ACP methyl ester carboxylesterase